MIETYFFIPADKPPYFKALKNLTPDHFIFDLEDAVIKENLNVAIENLIDIEFTEQSCFVRLPSIDNIEELTAIIKKLYPKFSKFFLPKVEISIFISELTERLKPIIPIENQYFIIVIESPLGIINLKEIISDHLNIIKGVAFGSHDYCKTMNSKNEEEYFEYARQIIVNHAKAFGIQSIDIASTNLDDENLFKKECIRGFNMGFDAKPILHPWQLIQISKISFFTEEQIKEAILVYKAFNKNLPDENTPIKIGNKIIETPHLKHYKRIIDYLIKIKSKNYDT
jgi:citrate lyase beta subunit